MNIKKELDNINLDIDIDQDGVITDSPEDVKKIEEANIQPSKHYFMSTRDTPKKKVNPRANKQHKLDLLLIQQLGPDVNKVINKLVQIAMYDPDQMELVKDKDGKEKLQKKRNHYYNANVQMTALTLLLKYYYGDPRKEIQIDQNVDVKIEKKVADLTKLINDNQERLKVINGGK